jgi:hypothetical protein
MVTPRMGLMVLFAGAARQYQDYNGYDESTLGQVNLGIALQYWASPKLWLKGGLVSSHLSVDENGEVINEAEGGGILAAIGYEFYRTGRFIMDGQLRVLNASHDRDGYEVSKTNTVGLLVGLNWY